MKVRNASAVQAVNLLSFGDSSLSCKQKQILFIYIDIADQ